MRFGVKPHSGILCFFLCPRGASPRTLWPLARASLLSVSWHLFFLAALPSPQAAGERRGRTNAPFGRILPPLARCWRKPFGRLASGADRAKRPDHRLSVGRALGTPAPFTLYAL